MTPPQRLLPEFDVTGIRKYIPAMHPEAVVLAGLSVITAVIMVLTRPAEWTYTLIAIASVLFVLSGVAGRAWKHEFSRFLLLGLVLCCVGDLAGPHDFMHGTLAFLGAHLAFIAAFLVQGIEWRRFISPLPLVAAATWIGLAHWLLPHVPSNQYWLVLSYMSVLFVMVCLTSGIRFPGGKTLLMCGALIFLISDIFVARWKFVDPSAINAFFCYPLYYISCALIALTISVRTRASEQE